LYYCFFHALLRYLRSPRAQNCPTAERSTPVNTPISTPLPRYHELSFYTGQSFGYPLIMSSLKDQRLFVIGLRYTQFWHAFRHMNMNWNADIKPLALYSNDLYGPREYTYGGGVTLGAQFVPHTHWRCQPVFDMDGGMIAFTKDTPVPDSRRVNLTLISDQACIFR
jgi:hypothetical protein